jgi:hypothetical protein
MLSVPSIAAVRISVKLSALASVNELYAQSISLVQFVLIRVIRCCV